MREELSEYLDGLQEQMPLAFWKLAEIFKYQVFELCEEPEEKEEESGKSYLIPYMMNDAIEDYLVLENCRMVGEVAAEEQAGGLELSARISGKACFMGRKRCLHCILKKSVNLEPAISTMR